MRKLTGVLGAACLMTAALAQPAPKPADPATTPPPAAPSAPSAVQPNLPVAQPTTPAAEPAKKWVIPADAKPTSRQEIEGIVIEDFVVGTGAEVKPGNAVLAFYHGTVKASGETFDSAFERAQPIAFPLNGVIQGWTKGVPGMKVGGLRRLTIPAALAYGATPPPGSRIPANADLVFVIEMVDVIQTEDAKVGTGEEVGQRAICTTKLVVKDASGKELVKTADDNPYVWLPGENDLAMGLIGMQVGGKRTMNIPVTMNKANGQYPPTTTQIPAGQAVTVEVELIGVRNLIPLKPKQ